MAKSKKEKKDTVPDPTESAPPMVSENSSLAISRVEGPRRSLAATMSAKLDMEPGVFLNSVIATCFPAGNTPSNEQVLAFLVVANEYGLNPFVRQIYAFESKGGAIVPIVPIDGWLAIINRHPEFDGMETLETDDDEGNIYSATTTIYRKDRKYPTVVTEYYAECYRDTGPWNQHPRRMLRHKSAIQCGRYAFGLSGISDPDEGEGILESIQQAEVVTMADAVIPEKATPSEAVNVPESIPPLDRDAPMAGGEHEGKTWRELPEEYIQFILNKSKSAPLKQMAQQELDARALDGEKDDADGEDPIPAEGKPFPADDEPKNLGDLEDHLVDILTSRYFTDEERENFGPNSGGAAHDQHWLETQIQFVEAALVKRERDAAG